MTPASAIMSILLFVFAFLFTVTGLLNANNLSGLYKYRGVHFGCRGQSFNVSCVAPLSVPVPLLKCTFNKTGSVIVQPTCTHTAVRNKFHSSTINTA